MESPSSRRKADRCVIADGHPRRVHAENERLVIQIVRLRGAGLSHCGPRVALNPGSQYWITNTRIE